MLEKFREGSQGPGAKIILGAVIVTFALAGVSSYLGGGGYQSAATVNGVDISKQALEKQVRTDRSRLESQQGESFAARWEQPEFQNQVRQQSLNTLVAQNLLQQMTDDLALRIGDEKIRSYIFSMEQFQTDGVFNDERYISLLRQSGMTPAQFVERLRTDFAQQQLTDALVNSEFSLPSEVKQLAALQNQQRELSQLIVPVNKFASDVVVTDAEVSRYYEDNKAFFQTQQQASADYILVDMKNISAGIELDADAAENYYNEHVSSYTQEDKRKVAHILVTFNDDEAAAEAKAQDLLAKIQSGADFAELAKSSSDDTFSGENGGDLGWLEKDIMDPAFETAAFALKNDGDVTTELVRSDFGFHIIKLLAVEPGKVKAFADVKATIETRLKNEQAVTHFDELAETLAEQAFEVPDSLDVASEETGLKIVSTELFSANAIPAPLNDPKVAATLFDQDFIAEALNSEIINISDEQSIVVRINEYKPQTTKSLVDVNDEIVERLKATKAEQKARSFMNTVSAKVDAGESIDAELAMVDASFTAPEWLSRFDYTKADFKVLSKLFSMPKPAAEQVSVATETSLNGDVTLLKFTSVRGAEMKAEEATRLADTLKNINAQADYEMLIQTLIKAADVSYPVVEAAE
ncbi:Peptidyl-prolyl cis-trans isomerase D (PPIase D) (Rotamase D) [Moritella viscosa]|uniref:SurA N-terminal domain-containing protein n=1 Tax=Moritella viscosa TaxID=80854 RepID=UPI000508E352|nr:SurA N-terminal domain-containing protein [Moritella viscosa]CED61327.1 peptidyl-prolyl cis-trans isomerase D [Moritella viscosa]SGY91966.1 Peptidyl-prolyl cis-trans isomerase D (PPIase D) (Rotamase D) [Moritella viscosa]SHO04812.1 Peptidyl-prolyl cis-trans isomerase D (PPIase D) (Rotamase D) [Moritella viscosa]SHO21266.1 Peptidyl-prolyl cis-trans isomerase D (PPIase D) (Rotamase D) [Moritella viscosa]